MSAENKIISEEEVEKIAELSRIKLSKEEKEKVTDQLASVLSSVKVLEEIDMSDINRQGFSENVAYDDLREDEIEESDEIEKEAIRKNFSSRKENFLRVKSMF